MLEYLKRVFYKKQPKLLQESNNKIENTVNSAENKFVEQLRVKNSIPIKVETTICVQNGLGFEEKIKG